jgi:hypothetical protein
MEISGKIRACFIIIKKCQEDEMGGVCSAHGEMIILWTKLWLESLKGIDHLEDLT